MKKEAEAVLNERFGSEQVANLNKFMEKQFSRSGRDEIVNLMIAAAGNPFISCHEILLSLGAAWFRTWASQRPEMRADPGIEENKFLFNALYVEFAYHGAVPERFRF